MPRQSSAAKVLRDAVAQMPFPSAQDVLVHGSFFGAIRAWLAARADEVDAPSCGMSNSSIGQMSNKDRAESYSREFPSFPPLRADDRWIDGVWMLGNNYKGSGYYGAYPPGYLNRIAALFPDVWAARVLHPFSGSLRDVHGVRVDLNPANAPDLVADACALPFTDASFDLLLADPPYSTEDAKRYGTPMVDRRKALREFARVTCPGGHLVWLDTVWPMFAKRDWHCFGQIGIVRSTNHRVRLASLFRRCGP